MFGLEKKVVKRNRMTVWLMLAVILLSASLIISIPVYAGTQSMETTLGGGMRYSAMLKSDGTVWAWGLNNSGQLGDGTIADRLVPAPVQFPEDTTITAISVGKWHTVALDTEGKVWAWGSNTCGKLGDGTTTNRNTPVRVQGLDGKTIVAVAAGDYHTVALDDAGEVWAWGYNKFGQLGLGYTSVGTDYKLTPQPVVLTSLGSRKATAIAAGKSYTAILADDGTAWACGNGSGYMLGWYTLASISTLGQVPGLASDVFLDEIAIGLYHMVAKDDSGRVYIWGDNHAASVQGGLTGKTITAVAADEEHNAVLGSDGTIWAWGNNTAGQLGNGTTSTLVSSPGEVSNLEGVSSIAAGYDHMLALKSDGSLWAWGCNSYGQLGNNSKVDSYLPVRIDASLTADRTLKENTLDGAQLTAELRMDSFQSDISAGQFSLHNAPDGLSISGVQYISATQCAIDLSFDGTDFDSDIDQFGISIAGSALSGGRSMTIDGLGIAAIDEPRLSTDQALTDSNLDGRTLDLELQTGTFTDSTLDPANFTLNNAPSGLSILDAQYISITQCAIALSFDGTDFNNSITDFSITINGDELSGGDPQTSDLLTIYKLLTVTFNSNGSIYDTKTVNEGESIGSAAWPADPSRDGYTFGGWFTGENGSGVSFTATTPVNAATTVYAKWTNNSDSSSGSGNHRSKSPTPTAPTYQADVEAGNRAETPLPVAVDKDAKTASVDAGSQNFTPAGTVLTMPSIPGVETYTVSIPVSGLKTVNGQGSMTVNTDMGSVTVPSNMLTGIEGINGDAAEISITRGDKNTLPKDVKDTIDDKPLIQLTLSVDSKQADWNNPDAPVTVSIPYTPTEEELVHPDNIVIWYIDGIGNVVTIPSGRFDEETGTVTFQATHFSDYAVAYNKVNFTDVPDTAWYSAAVNFIAAREITTGTGNGTFSPKTKLTRGEFIVLMMRAYGINPDEGLTDNFSDAGSTYYTGYLAAAKRLEITSGVGNNLFAPSREVTRQEMFTLLYNTLHVIGKLPEGNSGKTLSDFTDAGQISAWAKEAMTLMVETGTVGGNNSALTPLSSTTRAEIVQVLYNMMK